MDSQLVLDWDRLENFLIIRYRPVGNIATNTKCQSWISHVHCADAVYYRLSKWCTDRRQSVCYT